jgi:hypothetical protein
MPSRLAISSSWRSLQGVCAHHAAMTVSFDRPELSLGALVLIPIGRAADRLHWITYVVTPTTFCEESRIGL